jgi:hypothetical protein
MGSFLKAAGGIVGVICLTTIIIVIIGICKGFSVQKEEKQDFMSYCTSKGKTVEDCRWEWKKYQQ